MNQKTVEKIGLSSATIICMNAMIGAGIFATPAKLATSVGPAGIITYIFVIIAVLFMALSLAKVAQEYPQEGSFYNYANQWGGHFVGVLSAGSYILGVIIALGLISQIAAQYLHSIFDSVSVNILGIILISSIVALNVIGVKIMQIGQIILLCCTLFALFSVSILCLFNGNLENLTPFMPNGFSSLTSAVSTAIFAFFGFESAASIYSIVKNPEKNVSSAFTLSLLIVGAIYIVFIGSIILAIPANIFESAKMPLSDAIIKVFPKYAWLAKVIGLAILTALLGVLQSMTYSVSALIFSFLKILENNFAKSIIESKYGFEIIVILVGLCTAFNFFVIKNMDTFFNLTAMFIVFAFATSIITLIVKNLNKNVSDKMITYLGLITAGMIFFNALSGLL